jgi:hypothetical protein
MSSCVALCAVFGALVGPACEIKIGPGTGGGPSSDPATTAGAGGAGGSSGTWTPEELAADDAIQHADQAQIALLTATAAYAAVDTASLVDAQGVDPSTLDAASASQLVDASAPDGIAAALAWAQSVDPSLFPASYYPKFECIYPPTSCPHTIKCPDFSGICVVTDCGSGSCPSCPAFSNLIIKSWCAYGCVSTTGDNVGGAFILNTFFGPDGPHCFPK